MVKFTNSNDDLAVETDEDRLRFLDLICGLITTSPEGEVVCAGCVAMICGQAEIADLETRKSGYRWRACKI